MDNNEHQAVFNVIISYPELQKAILTKPGYNKEQVREEVLEQFSHIEGLNIETIDLIDGEEVGMDNVVIFPSPKKQEEEEL